MAGRHFGGAGFSVIAGAGLLIAAGFVGESPVKFILIAVGLLLIVAAIALVKRSFANAPASRELRNLIFNDKRSIFVTAASGEVLTRNSAALRVFGDRPAEVLEDVLSDQIPNVGPVVFRLQSKTARETSAQEDVATPEGSYKFLVHRIPGDKFLWAIENSTDFAKERGDIEAIGLPILISKAGGTVAYMNEAARRIAETRVKSLDQIFTKVPDSSGEVHKIKTEEGEQSVQVMVNKGPSGRTEYVLIPYDQENAVASGVANFRLLEDFPVALVRIRPNGQIVQANKLSRKLLSIEHGANDLFKDLIGGLGRPVSDWLADAAEGRSLHQTEVIRAKREDEERYLQITLGREIENGEVMLVAMITDATELKTLEAQFVQSQKMQAIGQLAGGVAHDFNNLLTAISGHCDLLMLRHDPGDMDYSDLEQINQNANRAASLVSQLLAFSRKQNLQLEVLDMRDTLSDLTHLLNRLVGAQISLNLLHDPQLQSVRADRRQLEQVIMNLVVNARDAMGGQGGEITIETRNAKLQSDMKRDRAVVPRGDYVVVKVRDNGSGISFDKLSKIFEPFYTTKRTGEGTGLGLSTAYGIVKQSGGFIFVDSSVGQGTEFTIFFPTYDRPEVQEEAAHDTASGPDVGPIDGVVLLVEDEAPVRAFASRALQLRGFKVLEAASGEEALAILTEDNLSVDIVVTDVVMPGLDGPSWVKQARVERPDLKVIFVSGYAEENFNHDQSDIPNSIFLPKPFSLNELTSTVRGQLSELAA
ncbi:MAG: ATP-binding protein [Litoreibacter sp.]|nr:ATP-binding protein [Litoreibacter sp.]